MSTHSKSLGFDDQSAFDFVKEMLKGDNTYAINFDRIQWDNHLNQYVIIEYLLCDEKQFPRKITPYSSHPKRYFKKNSMKFISLWELSKHIDAKLYLVNYSKAGTLYENEVLLMEVVNVDETSFPYVTTNDIKLTRNKFSDWFRNLNKRGIKK